jgi:hypothetical protein
MTIANVFLRGAGWGGEAERLRGTKSYENQPLLHLPPPHQHFEYTGMWLKLLSITRSGGCNKFQSCCTVMVLPSSPHDRSTIKCRMYYSVTTKHVTTAVRSIKFSTTYRTIFFTLPPPRYPYPPYITTTSFHARLCFYPEDGCKIHVVTFFIL